MQPFGTLAFQLPVRTHWQLISLLLDSESCGRHRRESEFTTADRGSDGERRGHD